MNVNKQILIATIALTAILASACIAPPEPEGDVPEAKGEIPTWTPRPQDAGTLPTPTKPAPVSTAITNTPAPTPTRKVVKFSVAGGNLNIRRGPSLAYNYVGVLYDGDEVQVIGRDRISRWLMIALPSDADKRGWVTTETKYSTVSGDVGDLPFIETEPASPAFIRNCTKHKLWILPMDIYLLPKSDPPFNEERFNVGTHYVYDLENPDVGAIGDVELREGKTVEIVRDWTGEKTKCE